MLPIPPQLQAQFEDHLRKKAVPKQSHGLFKKWLRYYLDFWGKYQIILGSSHAIVLMYLS
jgi:hypothetical protein